MGWGDFQVDDQVLEEMEFIKAIKGQTRVADKRIGTCTSTVPASTIDYRIIHEKLERMGK